MLKVITFSIIALFAQIIQAQHFQFGNADTTKFEERLAKLAWQQFPGNDFAKLSYYNPVFHYGSLELDVIDISDKKLKSPDEKLKIQEEVLNSQRNLLRAEVYKRYEKYMSTIDIHKLRVKAAEEAHLIHLITSKKFKNDESNLDDYNKSFLLFNNAEEARLNAESQLAIAKIHLEELIGTRLEQLTGSRQDNNSIVKRGDTLVSKSGLKYIVKQAGFGDKPENGQTVKVFYTGRVLTGKVFESNVNDNPLKFVLGAQQALPGLDEGIRLMREGEKGILIIPAKLAYGKEGIRDPTRPEEYIVYPNSSVIYEIHLMDVK